MQFESAVYCRLPEQKHHQSNHQRPNLLGTVRLRQHNAIISAIVLHQLKPLNKEYEPAILATARPDLRHTERDDARHPRHVLITGF